MKRLVLSASLLMCCVFAQGASTVPPYITYQGALKQKGLPANGPHNLSFKLTDISGSAQYGSVVNLSNVAINQGLFAVQLDFTKSGTTPVEWDKITPYIQVSIDGQALSPTEPFNATAYSLMSASVIDGAITHSKIAPATQPYLIPPGMIAMFDTSCPDGWTRFAALDNQFPMGAATYGAIGGSTTHSHGISVDGAHVHYLEEAVAVPTLINAGGCFALANCPGFAPLTWGRSTPSSGSHDHGGNTGTASTLPPYLAVVFCKKI